MILRIGFANGKSPNFSQNNSFAMHSFITTKNKKINHKSRQRQLLEAKLDFCPTLRETRETSRKENPEKRKRKLPSLERRETQQSRKY